MSRRSSDLVREALAVLGERGHAADLDLAGKHFKIRWVANGRKHLLVIARSPSDCRACANSRATLAAFCARRRAPNDAPAAALTRSTVAYPGHGLEVWFAIGVHCCCGRELRPYDFGVVGPRVRAICQGCHQDDLAVDMTDVGFSQSAK
jgi:hypothetical protein